MRRSFIETVVGNLAEKRAWRQRMKRVDALPAEYRFAYQKIVQYGYQFGFCCTTQSELLELFEESAGAGRPVLGVIGGDAAAFCDGLIRASGAERTRAGEALNREILEHIRREGA